jgi:hypothetical protein
LVYNIPQLTIVHTHRDARNKPIDTIALHRVGDPIEIPKASRERFIPGGSIQKNSIPVLVVAGAGCRYRTEQGREDGRRKGHNLR